MDIKKKVVIVNIKPGTPNLELTEDEARDLYKKLAEYFKDTIFDLTPIVLPTKIEKQDTNPSIASAYAVQPDFTYK